MLHAVQVLLQFRSLQNDPNRKLVLVGDWADDLFNKGTVSRHERLVQVWVHFDFWPLCHEIKSARRNVNLLQSLQSVIETSTLLLESLEGIFAHTQGLINTAPSILSKGWAMKNHKCDGFGHVIQSTASFYNS